MSDDLEEGVLPRHASPAEVAEVLGCSARWVTELVDAGELTAIDIGLGPRGTSRISIRSVLAFLERRRRKPRLEVRAAVVLRGGAPSRRKGER